MEITEVRIKLMEDPDDRLQAFCSITFDGCFVVRDLKIIEGSNGPFVAMPSRKLTAHCPKCGYKNHLRGLYCNQCGRSLKEEPHIREQDGRTKLYADIAHPINSECREMIQERVIREYVGELDMAKKPGYESRYDEGYGDDIGEAPSQPATEERKPQSTRVDAPRTHIEPAQTSPPAPHKVPTKSPTVAKSESAQSKSDDDFGAGIF